jgi:hypothetical protein
MPFALVDTRRCFNLDICFDPMEVVNTCDVCIPSMQLMVTWSHPIV